MIIIILTTTWLILYLILLRLFCQTTTKTKFAVSSEVNVTNVVQSVGPGWQRLSTLYISRNA